MMWDFVVVGSGPAGSAFASGVHKKGYSVIVIERGEWLSETVTARSGFPRSLSHAYAKPECPPTYAKFVAGGSVRAVGGSAALNAGALIEDYEYWETDWNDGDESDDNWKSSRTVAAGRLLFSPQAPPPRAEEAFCSACERHGFERRDLLSAWERKTVGAPRNVFEGDSRRHGADLLTGIRIMVGAEARSLIWRRNEAIGVRVVGDGSTGIVFGKKVVVAAGAEESSRLLFRSGLDNLGQRYRDHPTVIIPFLSSAQSREEDCCFRGVAFDDDYQISYCVGNRLLLGLDCYLPRKFVSLVDRLLSSFGTVGALFVTVSRPKTCATLYYDRRKDKLRCKDDGLRPEDRRILGDAVRLGKRILNDSHPSILNRLLAALASMVVATMWHSAGGVPRSIALRSADLRLRNTTNVHVVGVAAMPRLTRANPMASCYAMGARLAEILTQ